MIWYLHIFTTSFHQVATQSLWCLHQGRLVDKLLHHVHRPNNRSRWTLPQILAMLKICEALLGEALKSVPGLAITLLVPNQVPESAVSPFDGPQSNLLSSWVRNLLSSMHSGLQAPMRALHCVRTQGKKGCQVMQELFQWLNLASDLWIFSIASHQLTWHKCQKDLWNIYTFIWANYNNSLTWIKAIWGWFPLLTIISSELAVSSL